MPLFQANGDEIDLEFQDLVDIVGFSSLLENFYAATGIPNGLVGTAGDIITQAGWVDACTLFHRVNPETNRRCRQSNLELMRHLRDGEVACSLCKNGLIDYATPVVIEGRQLATLFLGQVLSLPPDMTFFREQAARCGFDEAGYLEAIRAVPVVSRARMESLMECMVEMAQMLVASSLARLRQTTLERDLDQSTEQRIALEDLLKLSPVGIKWSDAHGRIEYINRQFTTLFGYTLEDAPNLDAWYRRAYPDSVYRKTIIDPWHQAVARARQDGTTPPELEADIVCKDGSERRALIRVSWVGRKRVVNFSDITAHWQSERRNRTRNAMLEMVARGEPLSDILHAIVRAIESEAPALLCSVLLADDEGKHLLTGAAPSLPAFFNEAVDGIGIGPNAGSCAAAAFLGERVVVEDVMRHEYWKPYAKLAKRAGLRACWSEPIIASNGRVLGTFAIYRADAVGPSPADIDRISFAANLAAIAIENRNTREELVERERAFRSLAENAPDNIARYDTEGRLIYLNPRLEAILGKPAGQLLGKRPSEHFDDGRFDHYEEKILHVIETGEETMFESVASPTPMEKTYNWLHMVAERDESGAITGVLALGRDITKRKQLEKKLEHQAHFDHLTGLANRRHFLDQARSELARIGRYGGELSLIMFDIDHFKRFNDTYGHDIGDLVLQKIAEIGRKTIRKSDIIGRIGGEEFVVLLPHTDKQRAMDAAERLRVAIAKGQVRPQSGSPLRFTASFGVITTRDKSKNIDELLIQVDAAMYQAKESGRNRVCSRAN
jgi:diguanylate cyclase (GGDEF)-like protein/PAS domain S-box-containing protein